MGNQIKTILLLGVLGSLLVAIGGAIDPTYLGLYGGVAVVMNLVAYFYSDQMVLKMHGAREVSPQEAPDLHAMVEELAGRAGIPKPKVYRIADSSPNAFATGRNPAHGVVAVTDGIVRLLDRRELRGVLAHELGHIRNRDILLSTIAAVLVTLITTAASMARWAAMFGGGRRRDDDEGGLSGVGLLVLAVLAPLGATLVNLCISRSREYLADDAGAEICGDPGALADALLKLQYGAQRPMASAQPATASMFIVNPLAGMSSVQQMFSTHPAIEDRVGRLRQMAARGR